MDRFYRLATIVMFVVTVFGCSGGGCSGCAACGIQPIPGAFPIDQRVPNSAQFRLTQTGIQFIDDNIGSILAGVLPGGLNFPIPSTSGSTAGGIISYTLCPDNNCQAHA